MRISIIGSCLSASVALSLSKKVNNAEVNPPNRHLRSDLLISWLEKRSENWLVKLDLHDLIEKNLGNVDKNQARVMMQSVNRLSKIPMNIRKSDIILIDPNYDLSREVTRIKMDDGAWSPAYLCDLPKKSEIKGQIKTSPLISINQSRSNYKKIFEKIKSLNPDVKIFFLNYPVTGFKKHGNKNRVLRQEELAKTFNDHNATIIPLVELNDGSLTTKGSHYFTDNIYDTFADYIINIAEGKIKPADPNIVYSEEEFAKIASGEVDACKVEIKNPYQDLPSRNFWRSAVADKFMLSITDLYSKKFEITMEDKIATCGSCFAQHIGKRMQTSGFNYFDVEPAPEGLSSQEKEEQGYGIYSARYGNVYTTPQLNDLFDQAFDKKSKDLDEIWEKDNRFYDPYRPNLFANGFATKQDVIDERKTHLKQVKKMFEELDVFIFTLGLTECWHNKEKDRIYTVCPGTTAGTFDPNIHKFKNLSFGETIESFENFYAKLMEINPSARILLTVSPVPLTATAQDQHVLVSTIESKSILRAVAGELYRKYDNIDYFPSYEIVSSHPFKGMFYKDNLRQVRPEGVDFVMSHFFKEHATNNVIEIKGEDENEEFCDESFLELQNANKLNNKVN